jgi:quercetin dioxygenase-like cupin family protein
MIRYRLLLALAPAMIAAAVTPTYAKESGGAPAHVMLLPDAIQWGPFPAGGPGAQLAVVFGDPGKTGPFIIRIKTPDGFRIPPHWHPMDEHITVISGTLALGMGEKFAEKALQDLPAGSYARMPKKMPHFGQSRGETVVQVGGMGPFKVIYVNPADDPLKKKP